jgi:hypothetical protein
MARKLFPFSNNKVDQQFNEILYKGLTSENVKEDDFFILTDRSTDKKYRLYVDNGSFDIEEV